MRTQNLLQERRTSFYSSAQKGLFIPILSIANLIIEIDLTIIKPYTRQIVLMMAYFWPELKIVLINVVNYM